MTMEERIRHLMSELTVRDDAELVHEVRGFVNVFDDSSYDEKIRDAVGWAEIYVNPKGVEAYGGREAVRERLFQDLGRAADIAGILQGDLP